jgi:hypothetical protein
MPDAMIKALIRELMVQNNCGKHKAVNMLADYVRTYHKATI